MTASGPRDMLWLHAERGDRRKQRQQANDRHEEVQRFFHSNKFDALPTRFDTDWNNYFDSILAKSEREKREERFFASYLLRAGANRNNAMGCEYKYSKGEGSDVNDEGAHRVSGISYRRAT